MLRLMFIVFLIFLFGTIKSQCSFCYSISSILTFPTSSGPQSFVINDFNSDGNKDVVVANAVGNNLTHLSGLGTGSFVVTGSIAINGLGPVSVKSADINNDSKMDLVVANRSSKDLSLLLGSGTGTFSLPSIFTHSLFTDPTAISVVDVTKDGNVDIGVANLNTGLIGNPSRLVVLLGNGLSSFTYTYSSLGIAPALGMIQTDFDNDLNIDYVISGGAGHFNVIYGNSTGNFSIGPQINDFTSPFSLTANDFNNDGKLDIATGGNWGNCMSVFIWNSTGFLPTVTYSAGTNPIAIASGDLNNDGNIDIVVANQTSNNISCFIGNGNGTFCNQTNYSVGSTPKYVEIEDINNDGVKDIIVANAGSNTLSILLGSTCLTTINEIANEPIVTIFPNPVSDIISIKAIKNCALLISDVNGKVLLKKDIERGANNIDISSFSQGVYFISVKETGNISHYKFIKE